MLRTVLAVIAGFLTTVILALCTDFLLIQVFPGRTESRSLGLLAGTLLYTEIYAAVGGYVTGAIARSITPVYVLAGIAFALTAVNVFLVPNSIPVWYKAVSLLALIPATVLGGWLATRKLISQPADK